MTMQDILSYIAAHWSVIWPVVTAIITTAIGWLPPEKWQAMLENNRWGVFTLQILRALGTDVPGVIRAWRMLNDKNPPAGPTTFHEVPLSVTPPPVTKPDVNAKRWFPVFGFVFVAVVVAACLPAQTVVQESVLAIQDATCLWNNRALGAKADIVKCKIVASLEQAAIDFLAGKPVGVTMPVDGGAP